MFGTIITTNIGSCKRQEEKMGERAKKFRETVNGAAKAILDSSEMACSLRFESVRGCPYGAFTQRGVAALSSACTALAAVALVLGA